MICAGLAQESSASATAYPRDPVRMVDAASDANQQSWLESDERLRQVRRLRLRPLVRDIQPVVLASMYVEMTLEIWKWTCEVMWLVNRGGRNELSSLL